LSDLNHDTWWRHLSKFL